MNIAVIAEPRIYDGGGFQHVLSLSLLLNKKNNSDYNFIFFSLCQENINSYGKYGVDCKIIRLSLFDKLTRYLRRFYPFYIVLRYLNSSAFNKFEKILSEHDIDIVFFPSPSELALDMQIHNYIFTVWDLCHRDFVEFSEVRSYMQFEQREYLYKNACPKAFKVVTESEINKQQILRRYCVDESRIEVLPFLPSNLASITEEDYGQNYIDIKSKYRINGEYIFYPAQFWPHKNHIYILEGLKILKEKYNIIINAVFCGSDKGNLNFILSKAKVLGIERQIFYIGFVNNEELPYLYKQAIALVMPTYFGPTNIPPLEAFKLKCPVMYSDLPGLREQVKGAAILLDLSNPENLAINFLKLVNKTIDIKDLIESGSNIVESWTDETYWIKLKEIFDAYRVKLKCWK